MLSDECFRQLVLLLYIEKQPQKLGFVEASMEVRFFMVNEVRSRVVVERRGMSAVAMMWH